MPIPDEIKHIVHGISKVDEFTDQDLLKEHNVTVLNNMVLDTEGGKAVKRGGLTEFNSNAAGDKIYSLHDVVDENGLNWIIAAVGTTFKKSLKGTGVWSDIKTGLTDGAKTRIASYDGRVYVANGEDGLFVTDVHTTTWNLEVAKPDISLVESEHQANGDLTVDKRYNYALVYVTAKGEYSVPSKQFTHYFDVQKNSTDSGTPDQTIELTELPASPDSRVVAKILFRTEGDGLILYYHTRLENDDDTFTDDMADTDLDISESISFLNIPDSAKYSAIHKDRLFLANIERADEIWPAPVFVTSGIVNGVVFTTNTQAGGSMTASSTYKYKFVLVNRNNIKSDVFEHTEVLGGSDHGMVVQTMPYYDFNQFSIRIYRTKADGSVYYLNTTLSPTGNYNFVDELADGSLGDEYVALASEELKNAVVFSDIGKPAQIPALNALQVFPDDGDVITGIVNQSDGVLVLKTNSICKIFTSGSPTNWSVKKIIERLGCDDPNSIAVAGSRVYFRNKTHVYRYPDRLDIPLSLLKKYTIEALPSTYDAIFSQKRQWYILACGDIMLVYDEKYEAQGEAGAWYEFNDGTISSGYGQFYSTRYGIHL